LGLLLTERADLSDYLDFHEAFSSIKLPAMISEGRQFDMVYIDGFRLFEDLFVDFYFREQAFGRQQDRAVR
jgi:hypothetical protein